MANYVDCGNNVDLQTILMSLVDVSTDLAGAPTDNGYIRSVSVTEDTREDAVDCVTGQTLEDLVRASIALADDGRPALRVITEEFANGSGVVSAWTCAMGKTWQDVLREIFCVSTDGEVAIRIARIT